MLAGDCKRSTYLSPFATVKKWCMLGTPKARHDLGSSEVAIDPGAEKIIHQEI
jgi:hypothetical protein